MAFGTVNVGQPRTDENKFVQKEMLGVADGVATLDGEGKLEISQRPDIDCYTQSETDQNIVDAVNIHNGNVEAHPDIRTSVAAMLAKIEALDLKYGTKVTENAFTVTFDTLDETEVDGTWNETEERIEF